MGRSTTKSSSSDKEVATDASVKTKPKAKSNAGLSKLSSNVFKMKFMQRGVEAEVRKTLEEKQKMNTGELQWIIKSRNDLRSAASAVVVNPSWVDALGLMECGRRSFGKFNKEIEKLKKAT